ncbi:MAG: FMN-binding glutamate synthase family protein [Phycisphaerales bacterium]|nr:FMN-binding glutamate synthase family protein [Phycisphaerales bacterium]MCB9857060.1 FMN-binding glutamate synthase family protein [Phycisphaerales bacterium]MCB9861813.1 FMN-binding glutamate synthase family protein [Phycisphaerales bacterium]
MVRPFLLISLIVFSLVVGVGLVWPPVLWLLVVLGPVFLLGLVDALQRRHAVRRNFPVIGHFRYLFEMIRPEINQYFIESNTDGTPFSREARSLVYQRAKLALQTMPFGTQRDVYEPGYEWMNHSLAAKHPVGEAPRIRIGGDACTQPYEASLLNISAMSYGSLSSAAVRALNGGARIGGFYHNTGEGGLSPHHLEPSGDIVWQIGTGYFGCRNADGTFDPASFQRRATHPNVKMIEVKLSQGAKPGHGGILPAAKITDEIAEIRGVSKEHDVISPPAHSAFDSPKGLLEFVAKLRELSGGKPTGFKLCVGHPSEFLSICMAMRETGILPDFITVDGGEGGTGAAPLEFSNSMGAPLTEGLVFVHNALVGFDLRSKIRVIASGKIITAFNMAARIAAGADICNSARGFMFSLGCIQARRCNSNHCPVGVATQKPSLVRGLDVTDKTQRVANYHRETMDAFLELLGAAGLSHSDELRPMHIYRRINETRIETYAQIYRYLNPGDLLASTPPGRHWEDWLSHASADRFMRVA